MKDTNGTEIGIGDLVAYNQSGDIVLGVVATHHTVVHKRRRYYANLASGHAEIYTIVRNWKSNKLSKVRRPQSMMVIAKVCTTNQIGESIWRPVPLGY